MHLEIGIGKSARADQIAKGPGYWLRPDQQKKAQACVPQPALFTNSRTTIARHGSDTAAGRHQEPSLFSTWLPPTPLYRFAVFVIVRLFSVTQKRTGEVNLTAAGLRQGTFAA